MVGCVQARIFLLRAELYEKSLSQQPVQAEPPDFGSAFFSSEELELPKP